MPLYDYKCDVCGVVLETIRESPLCCEKPMKRLPSYPAMVKIKGAGGYPSRRKQFNGTAGYSLH